MPEYYYLTGLVTTTGASFAMPEVVYGNTGTTSTATIITTDSGNYYYYWGQPGLGNQAAQGQIAAVVTANAPVRSGELDELQRDLWQQWQVEEAQRLAQVQLQRDEADKKAEALLHLMLDPEQRAQFRKERYFEVITGGRRYRVKHGWAGNVFRLNEQGQETDRFCIHPTREIPVADNLVSQKLLLEANEAEFLRIANRTRLVAA